MARAVAARAWIAAARGGHQRDTSSDEKRRQQRETGHNFIELFHCNSPFLNLEFGYTAGASEWLRAGEHAEEGRNLNSS
jgi:hypothetical protein